MSILEDRERMFASDPAGMHRHLEGFPDQLREAVAMGQETPLSVSGDGITSVVVAGMGGSAIGGELAAGYLARSMSVPLSVVRGYSLPAYVGPSTFVYVSSYSGNTEETLSAYAEARERRARIVCSTTGGEVGRAAEESGHDIVGVPTGYPPRAALGFGLVPLLLVLGRLGLAPDPAGDIDDAIETAQVGVGRLGLAVPSSENEAKKLASWLFGHVPVVYGTAPATSVVANRWCGQFSENSKLVAHRNELPEMNHNEIVGWSGTRPMGGDARVVFLRDEDDHPRVVRRVEITREAIAATGAEVRDVASRGKTALGRLISLVQLGDFVSLYLAMLGGVDPTPVIPIDRLKKELARLV
jgi:glucose/mannose-6-phosphate isomerase